MGCAALRVFTCSAIGRQIYYTKQETESIVSLEECPPNSYQPVYSSLSLEMCFSKIPVGEVIQHIHNQRFKKKSLILRLEGGSVTHTSVGPTGDLKTAAAPSH